MSEHKIQTENLSPAPAEQQHGQTERSQELGSNPKTTEFTIDRSRWYRGQTGAQLLRDDGTMCCLGFYSLACGMEAQRLLNVAYPSASCLRNSVPPEMAWLTRTDTQDETDLLGFNDDQLIKDGTRERKIRAAFRKHDIKVKFTGGTK